LHLILASAFELLSHSLKSYAQKDLQCDTNRLGVTPAALHDLYPLAITEALRCALLDFDRQLPGFLCDDGLLHGVETRTSSPVKIGEPDNTHRAVTHVALRYL
jgi:uncharacterized FAD-dependent dehydrogenase